MGSVFSRILSGMAACILFAVCWKFALAESSPPNMNGDVIINEFAAFPSDRLLQYYTNGEMTERQIGWMESDFDDSAWDTGPGGIGYGDSDDATDVGAEMQGNTPSLYMRMHFSVSAANAARSDALRLDIDYDDGFIAFINGVEVARKNLGEEGYFFSNETPAEESHDAGAAESFALDSASELLVEGDNVLAIQVVNNDVNSSDLSMIADLFIVAGSDIQLVDHADNWRYLVGISQPPVPIPSYRVTTATLGCGTPWWELAYDDAAWQDGPGGFGYGDSDDATDLEASLEGITPSLYLRKRFSASSAQAATMDSLILEIDYDDGFIAYLNGKEIARRNMGPTGMFGYHDQFAFNEHEAGTAELIDLGAATDCLVDGDNILAIQVHNKEILDESPTDGDLSLIADLYIDGGTPDNLVQHGDSWKYWIGTAEPSGVLLDEDGEDSDWIELYNRGSNSILLEGYSLTDDLAEPRKWVFPAVTLGPGQYMLVFCSGKDRGVAGSELHTNFALNNQGEYLALFTDEEPPLAGTEFFPGYPLQDSFRTYALAADGSSFVFAANMTPGGANDLSKIWSDRVETPVASEVQGVKTSPFSLSLSTPDAGASIRYTTDGSTPDVDEGILYTGPVDISTNTAIVARAFKDGMLPSPPMVCSYIFGLDYKDHVDRENAFESLPIMSLVGDEERSWYEPFGIQALRGGQWKPEDWPWQTSTKTRAWWKPRTTGDYNMALKHGRAYERPMHASYMHRDGTPGFSTACGIRMARSDVQRHSFRRKDVWDVEKTKWSFRLFFRGSYSGGDLEYPYFFDSEGVNVFDKIAIRNTASGDRFLFDEYTRRVIESTGQDIARGNYFQMYINGHFMGYFGLVERLDEDYCKINYHSENGWDVIKKQIAHDGAQLLEIHGGDGIEFDDLVNTAKTADLSDWDNFQAFADRIYLNDFIDYILVNIYAVNIDWPVNNWIAVRERVPGAKWRFMSWDADLIYGTKKNWVTNTWNWNWTKTRFESDTATDSELMHIWKALRQHPDFALMVADRVQKLFYNGGALTDDNLHAIYDDVEAKVSPLLAYQFGEAFDHDIRNDWIPQRRGYMLRNLKNFGLWMDFQAPQFNQHGGDVSAGFDATLTNLNGRGDIYYTTDGTDPRVWGTGEVNPDATQYLNPFAVFSSMTVKARCKDGDEWSPLAVATFTVPASTNGVIITEVMADANGDDTHKEWVELYNTTDTDINIDGWTLSDNATDFHTISAGGSLIVPSHGYLVLGASSVSALNADAPVDYAYGADLTLGNSADELFLMQGDNIIHSVAWGDYQTTPTTPMTIISLNPDTGEAFGMASNYYSGPVDFWIDQYSYYGSGENRGTPGADNDGVYVGPGSDTQPPQLVDGWMVRSDKAFLLFDDILATASCENVSNYSLPGATIVEASRERHVGVELRFGSSLAAGTDHVLELGGIADLSGNVMPSTQINLRYEMPTVTISELMYDPADGSDYEFVELHNPSASFASDLSGFVFTDGIDFTMPAGTSIEAGGYLLVIRSDETTFRGHYGLDASVAVVGPYAGKLSNGGEKITLRKSLDGVQVVDFEYNDSRAWPLGTDGAGHSLVPRNTTDQPINWLDYGGNWRRSSLIGGSPGSADPETAPGLIVSEIMAHTDYSNPSYPEYDSNDWIELRNVSSGSVSLGGYFLSDDPLDLAKWPLPWQNLAAGDVVVFDEVHGFHQPITSGFGLNKDGEAVYLSYLGGSQDRIVDCVEFKGQESTASLLRLFDADNWPQRAPGFWIHGEATPNSTGAVRDGDLVISEVMYNPPATDSHPDPNILHEFVEVMNNSARAITLQNATGQWRLDGGVDFTFPAGVRLAADAYLLVVSFDPSDSGLKAAFESHYGISGVAMYGPYAGELNNKTERLSIERPQAPDIVGGDISWVVLDELVYFDQNPWPSGADGAGASLQRTNAWGSGVNPENWKAASPTPGQATRQGPSIQVYYGSNDIANKSGPHALGSVVENSVPFSAVFTVKNSGQSPMSTSNLILPNGWSISESLEANIDAGASDTFTVSLSQAADPGTWSGTVAFETNDEANPLFQFSISAQVVAEARILTSQTIAISASGSYFAGAWDYSLADYTGSIEASGDSLMAYDLESDHWLCICINDHDRGKWTEGLFVVKNEWYSRSQNSGDRPFDPIPLAAEKSDLPVNPAALFNTRVTFAAESESNIEFSAWDFTLQEWASQESYFGDAVLGFDVAYDQWYCVCLYNVDSGRWIDGIYLYRQAW